MENIYIYIYIYIYIAVALQGHGECNPNAKGDEHQAMQEAMPLSEAARSSAAMAPIFLCFLPGAQGLKVQRQSDNLPSGKHV